MTTRNLPPLASCLALIGCLLLGITAQARDKRPNIVFIIADDMLPQHFNCLPDGAGKNLTPNLDRLAREGTVMLGQHVSSPVCTPSRFSCLTGTYASRSNGKHMAHAKELNGQTVVQWNTFIAKGDQTLATRLRDAGYRTGAVGKNHVIETPDWVRLLRTADPASPDVKRQLAANAAALRESYKVAGFDYAERIYHHNPNDNGPQALAVHNLDWIAQGAVDFIATSADQPFFLYMATTVPHGPREHHKSWKSDPRITPLGKLDQAPTVLPPRETIPTRLKAAGIEPSAGTYANREDILWMDDMIGAVIAELEAQKVLDDTVILFFNDHGQLAKGTLYQGGITNPSIIWRQGGFACGATSPALVSNIDFMPTLLELAGVDPAICDGRSFVPILNGKAEQIHDYLYFELGYSRAVRQGHWKYLALRYPKYAQQWTLEERQQKLDTFNKTRAKHGERTFNTDPRAPFSHVSLVPGGGGAEHASYMKLPGYQAPDQLYHLAQDPSELRNLVNEPAAEATRQHLRALLQLQLNQLSDAFPLNRSSLNQN